MARCQVLLVGQDAGVETDHDADVLAKTLVTLGGKFGRHAAETEHEEKHQMISSRVRGRVYIFSL